MHGRYGRPDPESATTGNRLDRPPFRAAGDGWLAALWSGECH